ncbi:hypothetical protein Tco_1405102 [Tanacetum coccineum]
MEDGEGSANVIYRFYWIKSFPIRTDTPVIPTETPIIAPTIPPSPDYTPASPDYSPASDSESDPSEDPSSDHIPPLPATSPFLSSDDDPTDNSSSEASSDFHSDASSDPLRGHHCSDHFFPDFTGTSAVGLSRRVVEVEVDPRETSLRDDVIVRVSDEPYLEQDSDPEIQAEIDGVLWLLMLLSDIPEPDQEGSVEIEEAGTQGCVGLSLAVIALTERLAVVEAREAARDTEPLNENGDELEGDNGGNGNGNGNGGNGNGNGGNGNGNGGNGNGGNGNRNGNHG